MLRGFDRAVRMEGEMMVLRASSLAQVRVNEM